MACPPACVTDVVAYTLLPHVTGLVGEGNDSGVTSGLVGGGKGVVGRWKGCGRGVSPHLPDVGVLVRGARQDVGPIRTKTRLDEEGGGGVTSEGGCWPNVGPESVVEVVHTVSHAHKQP